MSRSHRTSIAVAGILALVVGGWILMVGGLLAWSGVSMVAIYPADGPAISFPVPMAAIEMVAWTAPRLVRSEVDRITVEADLEAMAPAVMALGTAIGDLPDGTLFTVEDRDQTVRIRQQRGTLRLEIDSDDFRVRIGVPSRSVSRTLHHLSRGMS